MSAPLRALVVCPGRGSYARAHLGSLRSPHPITAALDAFRASLGRPPLTALDAAPEFTPRLHVAGEHASLLTFACTLVDLAALDPRLVAVVGVAGNSMGFYTALHASGSLSLLDAARLVETLGAYQADRVIGHQLLYPLVDDDWLPSATFASSVSSALALPGVFLSIRLGGSAVLGCTDAGRAAALASLPPVERGGLRYPLPLPLHSAFHTPLMAETAVRARADLASLPLSSPSLPLVAGDGTLFHPWSAPSSILDYTLGRQLVEPFDLTLAITTALGNLAPDCLVLPGPGDNLGGSLAQILIALRWRGLRDRRDFTEAQASPRPLLLSLARPDQRARVTAARAG